MSTTKAQAVDYIRRVLDKISDLDGPKFRRSGVYRMETWSLTRYCLCVRQRHKARQGFQAHIFHVEILCSEFFQPTSISFSPGWTRRRQFSNQCSRKSREYWPDDIMPIATHETPEMPDQQVSNRVFVVHGRDDGTRNTVARFIESLELEPVILQEQANEGRTIIEKFEDHSDVGIRRSPLHSGRPR